MDFGKCELCVQFENGVCLLIADRIYVEVKDCANYEKVKELEDLKKDV